jgi:hypothetical protein
MKECIAQSAWQSQKPEIHISCQPQANLTGLKLPCFSQRPESRMQKAVIKIRWSAAGNQYQINPGFLNSQRLLPRIRRYRPLPSNG